MYIMNFSESAGAQTSILQTQTMHKWIKILLFALPTSAFKGEYEDFHRHLLRDNNS